MFLMSLKMHLWPKTKALREEEIIGHKHGFFHWLLVLFATLIMGAIFSLVGLLMAFTGWIFFQSRVSWLQLLIGLPLILTGASMILLNLYQILAAILDWSYSCTHCPFTEVCGRKT